MGTKEQKERRRKTYGIWSGADGKIKEREKEEKERFNVTFPTGSGYESVCHQSIQA